MTCKYTNVEVKEKVAMVTSKHMMVVVHERRWRFITIQKKRCGGEVAETYEHKEEVQRVREEKGTCKY